MVECVVRTGTLRSTASTKTETSRKQVSWQHGGRHKETQLKELTVVSSGSRIRIMKGGATIPGLAELLAISAL